MGKILAVTGLTGKKTGGYFAKILSDHIDIIKEKFPYGIRALVRNESNVERLITLIPDINVERGNIEDENYLTHCFSGVDTIVHIAGILYSKKILDIAIKCNVKRIIFVHTTGIYSKYKMAGEVYRKIDSYIKEKSSKFNIKINILRPTMIYGNIYDNNIVFFIKMVDKLPIIPVVNGGYYGLQPVHYEDLSKAYYDILINEDETLNKDYILSGKNPILLRNIFEEIGKNFNKKVTFISCPFSIAYIGSWAIYICSFYKIDLREKVQRLCEPRVYSHQEAKDDFGYNPRSFEYGIKAEVKEYIESKR